MSFAPAVKPTGRTRNGRLGFAWLYFCLMTGTAFGAGAFIGMMSSVLAILHASSWLLLGALLFFTPSLLLPFQLTIGRMDQSLTAGQQKPLDIRWPLFTAICVIGGLLALLTMVSPVICCLISPAMVLIAKSRGEKSVPTDYLERCVGELPLAFA